MAAIDQVVGAFEDMQLGNFDAVFDMLQQKLPMICQHRDQLKSVFYAVHEQMQLTGETISVVT